MTPTRQAPSVTSALWPPANPESFGLYFVLGVCFGLLLTLCLLVISISCAPRPRPRGPTPRRDPRSSTLEAEDDDDDDDEDTVTRPGPEVSTEPDGPLSVNVFTSAEELERAQRLEERERIDLETQHHFLKSHIQKTLIPHCTLQVFPK